MKKQQNKKIPRLPKKHCSSCHRVVYETTHTADTYHVDWYTRRQKIVCVDCYKGYK